MHTKTKDDFAALTSLRGIGALLVLQYHAWLFVQPAWPDAWAYHRFQLWPDYFFMLSGFIMMHVYGSKLGQGGKQGYYNYLIARIGRIYPLHLFALALLVVIEVVRWWIEQTTATTFTPAAFTEHNQLKYLITNIPLLQSWGIQSINSWNAPSWSISSEVFCYLIFPLLMLSGAMNHLFTKFLLMAYAIVALLAIQWSQGTLHVLFGLSLVRASAEFLIGCWIRQNLELIKSNMRSLPIGAMQFIVLLIVALAFYMDMKDIFFIPLWMLLLVVLTHENTFIARAMSCTPLYRLGELSYSIYLTHWLFLVIIGSFIQRQPTLLKHIGNYPITALLLLVGVVILFSTLTYRYIEIPARRWIRKECMAENSSNKSILKSVPLYREILNYFSSNKAPH